MNTDERNRANVVRIVLISDTHGEHRSLHVPDGDVLIHAGDFTLFNKSRASVRDFNQWLFELPFCRKLVIPGNHEFKFVDTRWRHLISAATFLLNEGVELDGIRTWGSPLTPSNFSSFGATSDADCGRIFSRIPTGTDLVITHGPPHGILDIAEIENGHQGCPLLLSAIRRVRPALHVFGHIHQSYGMASVNGTVFVNAALGGPEYRIIRKPIVIEYDRLTRSVRESGSSAGIPTRLGSKT